MSTGSLGAPAPRIQIVRPNAPRSDAGSSTDRGMDGVRSDGRLLLVSNRLPITVRVRDGSLTMSPSQGGLARGLASQHLRSNGLWIGWPGVSAAEHAVVKGELARMCVERRIVPVALEKSEVRAFYDQISNAILWPVFHERLDRVPLRPARWDIYEHVNVRFADTIADVYTPGDTIWVHDYQLLRLPALLRERIPAARIGFFLHVPFPPPDIFNTLSPRQSLLAGMLGADLIGFHTQRYAENFRATLERQPSVGVRLDGSVSLGRRSVQIGVYPMGIDVSAFAAPATPSAVAAATMTLRTTTQRLLLGVDRLDYSKGIPRRLLAIEELLNRFPEWRGRLRLLQVAVPTREGVGAYKKIRGEVEKLVGRINGKFATPTWTPIQYINGCVTSETLIALYRAADVMLVTPIRDGMNLVSKEFVASRIDEDGVLILSEFAGAAEELKEALLVNPYDISGFAHALNAALTMSDGERRHRMRRLRKRVIQCDVHVWADRFLSTLVAPQYSSVV